VLLPATVDRCNLQFYDTFMMIITVCICSGLGYIAGAKMAEAFHGWQWALRVSTAQAMFRNISLMLFSSFFICKFFYFKLTKTIQRYFEGNRLVSG